MSCSGVGLQGTGRVRTLPEPKGTAATYVSVLVRAHLRQLAPLPDRELSALRSTVNELAALGRNLKHAKPGKIGLSDDFSRAKIDRRVSVAPMMDWIDDQISYDRSIGYGVVKSS